MTLWQSVLNFVQSRVSIMINPDTSGPYQSRKRFVVGKAADLPPGGRLILDLDGRSVGVFNVGGRFFALHNRCPHTGGPLCLGPITGTTMPVADFQYVYGREGSVLRCAWHGWEFDIETGLALFDPTIRARTYPVTVENGDLVVHI